MQGKLEWKLRSMTLSLYNSESAGSQISFIKMAKSEQPPAFVLLLFLFRGHSGLLAYQSFKNNPMRSTGRNHYLHSSINMEVFNKIQPQLRGIYGLVGTPRNTSMQQMLTTQLPLCCGRCFKPLRFSYAQGRVPALMELTLQSGRQIINKCTLGTLI